MSRTAKSWHAHVNGDLCDGTPSDCPVTALRRARVTYDCFYGSGANPYDSTCEFAQRPPCDSETVNDDGPPVDAARIHFWHASLLLDGFSVEEVTAAEHTTESTP